MGGAEREPGLWATRDEVDPIAFRDHGQPVAGHAHVRYAPPPTPVVALDRRHRIGTTRHLTATGTHAAGRRRAGTHPAAGVVQRAYGETPAIIPGFKAVSMRDIIMQSGSSTPESPMKNAMVCHITEGEMQIVQDGREFVAKKNYVWTCNIGTREVARNSTNAVAVMRITDLMPA